MKLHLEKSSQNQIKAYDDQSITINETVYTESLVVMPEYLSKWNVTNFDTLTIDHFQRLIALRAEIVLLGTGQQQRFPETALIAPLIEHQIGLEVMDKFAACRTYNILMAEGRNVAAALIID